MTQIKTFSELGRFIIYHVYDIMDKLENPSHLINYPDLKKQIGERIQNDPRCQNPFVMHEYTSHHVFDTALHHHWNMGKPNTYRTYDLFHPFSSFPQRYALFLKQQGLFPIF